MRITIDTVKTSLGLTETYDIVNAIRNSASDTFRGYVPLANAENVAEVGAGLLINQAVQNEFITNLIDRIGLVVIKGVSLSNPLAKFKKGFMQEGRTIEEIFTDITKEQKYDPEDAETTVFKRVIPNVKVLFHELNRQGFYQQTVQDSSLTLAFTSWGNFESFVSGIIKAIYNSAEVDEYKYMKMIIDNYYAKGLFAVVPVNKPDTSTTATELIMKMRQTALEMSLPMGSRNYNALAVQTKTDMEDLHLIISAKLQARVDVDVLAKAFNMDRTSFLGNVTIVDEFASPGLEAVLVDREWFMVYDKLQKLETIRNPKGLYWNYYFHVWQIHSASRFSNAVAFVSGDVPAVSQVIIDPTILAVKPNRSYELTGYIRANDDKEHDLSWKVEGRNGTTVSTGTAISEDGVLTIGENQTGELLVSASVNIGTTETPNLVTGESIVTVE